MAMGLSKDGKWVFNKACTTPWCHAVVHFEVKTSRFSAVFQVPTVEAHLESKQSFLNGDLQCATQD